MTQDALEQLTDEQLNHVIQSAESLLKERTEKRRQDAMEEIRRIASGVSIHVSFAAPRRARTAKPPLTARCAEGLKAGERYQHPTDPSKVYIVGKGRPPEWFETLRQKSAIR